MTQHPSDIPCLLFALHREAQPFLRACRRRQRLADAPCPAHVCEFEKGTTLLLETGAGSAHVEQALAWLLDEAMLDGSPYRPQAIISAGYSGALQEDLAVGDVVLATEVLDENGNRWPGEAVFRERPISLHRGRLLCASRLIGDPAEKQRLGQQHAALAVDMESAFIARQCQERGIPFGVVRVISDTLHTPLSPRLLSLLQRERPSLWRLFLGLLTSPALALELCRLARDTKLAAERLATALEELLE